MQLTHSVAHEHVAASQVACLRTRVAAGWRVAARSAAAARVTAQTSADSCRLALDPKAAATARWRRLQPSAVTPWTPVASGQTAGWAHVCDDDSLDCLCLCLNFRIAAAAHSRSSLLSARGQTRSPQRTRSQEQTLTRYGTSCARECGQRSAGSSKRSCRCWRTRRRRRRFPCLSSHSSVPWSSRVAECSQRRGSGCCPAVASARRRAAAGLGRRAARLLARQPRPRHQQVRRRVQQ